MAVADAVDAWAIVATWLQFEFVRRKHDRGRIVDVNRDSGTRVLGAGIGSPARSLSRNGTRPGP